MELKTLSKNVEEFLRKNEHTVGRDGLLFELFFQVKRPNIERFIYDEKLDSNWKLIGSILINQLPFEKNTNDDTIRIFFENKENYFRIINENEWFRFVNMIKKSNESKETSSEFLENIEKFENILNGIRKLDVNENKIEKIGEYQKFFKITDKVENIILGDIITEEFEHSVKILYDSKINGYKDNRYENAYFLNMLATLKIIKLIKSFDEIVGLTADKKSNFKDLYRLISKKPSQKEYYINAEWSGIKKMAKGVK